MILTSSNRRSSPRQSAAENRARLEWWDAGQFHESDARLADISEGGALVVVESPPPLDATVWCSLGEPTPTDWVKAMVVRHGDGNHVGLSFPTSCPFDFRLAATLGVNFESLTRLAG
jgi:PilZ domain